MPVNNRYVVPVPHMRQRPIPPVAVNPPDGPRLVGSPDCCPMSLLDCVRHDATAFQGHSAPGGAASGRTGISVAA